MRIPLGVFQGSVGGNIVSLWLLLPRPVSSRPRRRPQRARTQTRPSGVWQYQGAGAPKASPREKDILQ